MKPPENLVKQVLSLDTVRLLDEGPQEIMSRAFPAEDLGRRAREITGRRPELVEELELPELEPGPVLLESGELPEPGELDAGLATERARLFEAGARAMGKVREHGEEADLTLDERWGLEAIVRVEGRPAILIQDGRFFPPPAQWQILEEVRDSIQATCRSVGRIEVDGHPSYEWVGTGFLVADDVIMTNRHVAEVFCRMGYRRRWQFKPYMSAQIDYVEELGAVASAEFALRSVIGVHEDFDLALFRVRRTSGSGAEPPEPLTVASEYPEAQPERQVYVVGYPAWDGYRNDPPIMNRIFSSIFNVKRLQPGALMRLIEDRSLLYHDCSTLGGNSGSCVVDLESHQVVGLHFGGRFEQGNVAVALWQLTDDPLLKKAKINFH